MPPLVLGMAPVAMLALLVLVRGPGFIIPSYVLLAVGLLFGVVGPAITPGLRRRMILGVPLLLIFAYWSAWLVMIGGGMPVPIDGPLRLLGF